MPVLADIFDVTNQDASNSHSLQRTPSNPLLPARDYLPDHHVHRNYYEINLLVGGRA